MNIADPKHLEYLRNLPPSYLLDLLADDDDIDRDSVIWVLMETGMGREDIDRRVNSRRQAPWKRTYVYWRFARWLTIINVLVVTYFNITGLIRLLYDDHIFKGPLVFLAVGSIIVGFIIGFKLTTHIYHGSKAELHCGFPLPVGFVELKSGDEISSASPIMMNICMAINALAGVSLTLFPLIFIYLNMG